MFLKNVQPLYSWLKSKPRAARCLLMLISCLAYSSTLKMEVINFMALQHKRLNCKSVNGYDK
jgi:hypothetical protein